MAGSNAGEGGERTRPVADNGSLLGRIALKRGLITQEQLSECIAAQEQDERAHPDRPSRPLGAILLAHGYLSDETLSELLAAQSETLKAPHPECPTLSREDLLLGKTLAREGMASVSQINAALRLQSSLNEQGTGLRLGEILVRKGILTPAQLKQALALQQKTLLSCTGCGRNFNVRHWRPEREVFCPKCSAVLAPPRSHLTIDAHDSNLLPAAAPASPPSAPTKEQRLGRYRLMEKLGEGGMGVVWKAWDTELKRMVALKEIKGGAGGPSDEDIVRFSREAQAAARLRHPGIVQVHDVGQIADRHYFTMDLVQGCSIAALLRKGAARPTLRRSLEIVKETAEALHYAHTHGIVHRDIKPANILIEAGPTGKPDSGRVLLTDFGLAEDVRASGGTRLTVSGDVMGTPAYMSPEQASGRQSEVGPPSDVFSVGATLYEMLTGHIPFPGDTLLEILEQIVSGDPLPPRRHVARIPRDVETLCLKALEKDPRRRYPSARALAEDIGRWLEGDPIRARPVSAGERLWRRAVKHRAIVFPSAAAAILAVLFGGWLLISAREKSGRISSGLAEAADLERRGKIDQARGAFRLVADLDPANIEARKGYERTDGALKATAAARDAEGAKTAAQAKAQKEAFALLELGRPALDEAFLYLYDKDAQYGDLVRRVETGQRLIEEAVAKSPDLALGHYLLGRAWELRGWDDKAEACWKKSLSLSADVSLAHYELGRVYLGRSILTMATLSADDRESRRPAAKQLASQALLEFEAAGRGRGLEDPIRREAARAALAYVQGEKTESLRIAHEAQAKFGSSRGTEELWWIAGLSSASGADRLECYNRAIALRPKFFLALLSRGDVLSLQGDFPGALRDLDEAMEVKPRQIQGLLLRGRALREARDLDRALADFNQALDVGGEPVEALDGRGTVWHEKGEWDAALADYGRAIELSPSFAPAFHHRGMTRREKSDLDGALSDFDRALSITPGYTVVLLSRSLARRKKGDYDGAIADCTEALRLQPSLSGAYNDRGLARLSQGDFKGAIADFDEALKIDPSLTAALNNRAIAREKLGDESGARQDSDTALRTNPQDPAAITRRGLDRFAKGDIDGSIVDFTEALKLLPNEPKLYANRGYSYLAKKDFRAAISDYTSALKLRPDYAVALCNRGLAHHQLGEIDAAITDYTAALASRPNYVEALADRGMAHGDQGDFAAAADDYARALEIAPATWEGRSSIEKALQDARGRAGESN